MKFFVSIIVTGLLAFACGLYLPWWSVAVAAFVVSSLIYQPPLRAFFTGFCAILLLWFGLVLKISAANENILAEKISLIMGMGGSYMLVILSCAIGAIAGGLGALSGTFFRKIF